MRRLLKSLLILGVIAMVVVVVKALLDQRDPAAPTPSPSPPPPAPEPPGASASAATTGWVEPDAGGGCPVGYAVKAKQSSKIFHVPGGASYDRTTPDRCYASSAAAEADGLRQAKR